MNIVQKYLSKFVFYIFCGCSFIIFSLFPVSHQGFVGCFIPKVSIVELSDLDISAQGPFHSSNQVYIAPFEVCENLGSECDGDDEEPSIDLKEKLTVSVVESFLEAAILDRHFNVQLTRSFDINPVSLVILYHSWKSFQYS